MCYCAFRPRVEISLHILQIHHSCRQINPAINLTTKATSCTYAVMFVQPSGILSQILDCGSNLWGCVFECRTQLCIILHIMFDACAVGTDPLGDVLSFIDQFEQVFGANHPEFYRGTYSQASFFHCFGLDLRMYQMYFSLEA